jgi:hypothetical protein
MEQDFGIVFKKSSPYSRPFGFPFILSSSSFIFLHSILSFMSYFEKNLKGITSVSGFIFLHVNTQLFQHHFWIKYLLYYIAFVPLSKIIDYFMWFISGFSVLFHWSTWLLFSPIKHCLDYCMFILSPKVTKCRFSNFVLLQYYVGYFGSFAIPYKL